MDYTFNVEKVTKDLKEHLNTKTIAFRTWLQTRGVQVSATESLSDLSVLAYEIVHSDFGIELNSNEMLKLTGNELIIANRVINNLYGCEVLLKDIQERKIRQQDVLNAYRTHITEGVKEHNLIPSPSSL